MENDIESFEEIIEFKATLIEQVALRFTRENDSEIPVLHPLTNKVRHVVTTNAPASKVYVLATALDPRIKLVPFQGNAHTILTIRIVLTCFFIFQV